MLSEVKSIARIFGPHLDPDVVREPDQDLLRVALPVVKALRAYFRAEVRGLEHMPWGRALVVGNHNAGITFLEPFVLGLEWYLHTEGADPIHPLGHDLMVALPVVGNLLQRLGVIRASHQTANQALAAGHKVLVFPGGNREAFRPFTQRHRVDFGGKTGFMKLALRNRVPIVPVLSVGGHETFFVLHRGEKLAEWTGAKKWLRSESFPIFLGLPWGIGVGPIFHLPLPAKSTIEIGPPLRFDDHGPGAADDPALVARLALQVQDTLQQMMDRRAAERRLPIVG